MRCNVKKANGKRCSAQALRDGDQCYWHSPTVEKERRTARSKGGSVKKFKFVEPDESLPISTCSDVVRLLEDTVNRVRMGMIDTKVANTIGFLSGHLLKAIENADLEYRLDNLEKSFEEGNQILRQRKFR